MMVAKDGECRFCLMPIAPGAKFCASCAGSQGIGDAPGVGLPNRWRELGMRANDVRALPGPAPEAMAYYQCAADLEAAAARSRHLETEALHRLARALGVELLPEHTLTQSLDRMTDTAVRISSQLQTVRYQLALRNGL